MFHRQHAEALAGVGNLIQVEICCLISEHVIPPGMFYTRLGGKMQAEKYFPETFAGRPLKTVIE
jgi:hypothetical protein